MASSDAARRFTSSSVDRARRQVRVRRRPPSRRRPRASRDLRSSRSAQAQARPAPPPKSRPRRTPAERPWRGAKTTTAVSASSTGTPAKNGRSQSKASATSPASPTPGASRLRCSPTAKSTRGVPTCTDSSATTASKPTGNSASAMSPSISPERARSRRRTSTHWPWSEPLRARRLTRGAPNAYGTLGNGRAGFAVAHTPTPVPGLSGVKAIAAAGGSDYALMANGTVEAWGDNQSGQLSAEHWPLECNRAGRCKRAEFLCGTEVGAELCSKVPRFVVMASGKKLEHVRRIVAGAGSAYALLENGEVMSWGQDRAGQLGQSPAVEPGIGSSFRSPGLVMMSSARGAEVLRGVTEISAGASHVLARLEDGEVVGWGDNAKGELGTAAHPETCLKGAETPCFKTARPVQGLAKLVAESRHHSVEALAAGGQYSLALSNTVSTPGAKTATASWAMAPGRARKAAPPPANARRTLPGRARRRPKRRKRSSANASAKPAENRSRRPPSRSKTSSASSSRCSRRKSKKPERAAGSRPSCDSAAPKLQPGVSEAGAPLEHVSAIAAVPHSRSGAARSRRGGACSGDSRAAGHGRRPFRRTGEARADLLMGARRRTDAVPDLRTSRARRSRRRSRRRRRRSLPRGRRMRGSERRQ